jgi:hypothetical protein
MRGRKDEGPAEVWHQAAARAVKSALALIATSIFILCILRLLLSPTPDWNIVSSLMAACQASKVALDSQLQKRHRDIGSLLPCAASPAVETRSIVSSPGSNRRERAFVKSFHISYRKREP